MNFCFFLVTFFTMLVCSCEGVKHSMKAGSSIPVIEIFGEGKPLTLSQIRRLEEISNGKPLDIKIEDIYKKPKCSTVSKRLDFVTFHYAGFTVDEKKFDDTYTRLTNGITIQLGVGMTFRGLDEGLIGMCPKDRRILNIPWNYYSQRNNSKVWEKFPVDEDWIKVQIEMIDVDEWTVVGQFKFMDNDKDNVLTSEELLKFQEKMENFGKTWGNDDIDDAIRYYIRHFDTNFNGQIELEEFINILNRDVDAMNSINKKSKKLTERNPSDLGWVLDFNKDGIVSEEEIKSAEEFFQSVVFPDVIDKTEL